MLRSGGSARLLASWAVEGREGFRPVHCALPLHLHFGRLLPPQRSECNDAQALLKRSAHAPLKTRACQRGRTAVPPVWGTVPLPCVSPCGVFLPLLVTLSRGEGQGEKVKSVNKPVPAVPLMKALTVGGGLLQTREPPGCQELTRAKTKAPSDRIVW